MIRKATKTSNEAAERAAVRRRLKRLYDSFNREDWAKCFALVDPKLTAAGKIDRTNYGRSLQEFKQYYGSVQIRHLEISLHLDARTTSKTIGHLLTFTCFGRTTSTPFIFSRNAG